MYLLQQQMAAQGPAMDPNEPITAGQAQQYLSAQAQQLQQRIEQLEQKLVKGVNETRQVAAQEAQDLIETARHAESINATISSIYEETRYCNRPEMEDLMRWRVAQRKPQTIEEANAAFKEVVRSCKGDQRQVRGTQQATGRDAAEARHARHRASRRRRPPAFARVLPRPEDGFGGLEEALRCGDILHGFSQAVAPVPGERAGSFPTPTMFDTTAASNVLKVFYLPPVRELLNNATILLSRIEKDSTTQDVSGTSFTVPLHITATRRLAWVARRTVTFRPLLRRGTRRPLCPTSTSTAASRSASVIAATKNSTGAFVRAIESEMKGLLKDTKRAVNRQLHGDGLDALGYFVSGAGSTTTYVDDNLGSQFSHFVTGQATTVDLLDASSSYATLNAAVTATRARGPAPTRASCSLSVLRPLVRRWTATRTSSPRPKTSR